MAVSSATLSVNRLPPSRVQTRTREYRWLLLRLIVSDAAVVTLSLLVAYWVRFASGLSMFESAPDRPIFYRILMPIFLGLWLLMFLLYRLYDRRTLLGGTEEYAHVFHASTVAIMLVVFTSFIWPDFVVARAWLLMIWGFTVIGCISTRFWLRRWVYRLRRQGRFLDRTLIVGSNPEGIAVAEQLRSASTSGAQVVGFIDDFDPAGIEPVAGVPVVGDSASFDQIVRGLEIDQVIIANSALTRERLLGIYGALDTLTNVDVRLASGLFELLTTGVRVREEGFVPLVTLNKTRIVGTDAVMKWLLDKIVAASALIVLSIPMAILAIMIHFDSPGPVFYRRRVVGQHNRPFDAFKLRTMHVNGDALLSDEQRRELADHGKLFDDPRITRVGRLLRKYSLDELPQLINVLLGQMSLIGPRMLTAPELEKFGRWQYNLRTVKPGLTGLWQISGRSDLSYEDRVRLDMYYIRNHSVWLDLRILIQTPLRILSGAGAY